MYSGDEYYDDEVTSGFEPNEADLDALAERDQPLNDQEEAHGRG